jgi:hypothetical protein
LLNKKRRANSDEYLKIKNLLDEVAGTEYTPSPRHSTRGGFEWHRLQPVGFRPCKDELPPAEAYATQFFRPKFNFVGPEE